MREVSGKTPSAKHADFGYSLIKFKLCKIETVRNEFSRFTRHPSVLLLILLLTIAAAAAAQEAEPGLVPAGVGIPLSAYPSHEISDRWEPVSLEPVSLDVLPHSPSSDPAADLCIDSTELVIPGGGQTTTNNMTRSDSDPALQCMWGSPSDPGGYRTVWYKVTPPQSGILKVTTSGSSYDTVLGVYTTSPDLVDSCQQLEQLACNDDFIFLSSEVNVLVSSNKTYFIEAADWNFETVAHAELSLSAVILPVNSWNWISDLDVARSRHIAVNNGPYFYVIGGQAVDSAGFPIRLNRSQRYDTINGSWSELARMCLPGTSCPELGGYSNTTAALLDAPAAIFFGDPNKRLNIYIPSGDVGNVDQYDGTHWVYNIETNSWAHARNKTWDNNSPTIYGAAVPVYSGSSARYFYSGGLVGPMPVEGDVESESWYASTDIDFYSPRSDSWSTAQLSPMPTGRFGHSSAHLRLPDGDAQLQDYICVVGGLGKASDTGGPVLIADGICYNSTGSGAWDKNIPELNYPRYFAASAVDSDGNWYVYGGTDAEGNSVHETERYDAVNNEWVLLDARFDLGTTLSPARPARSWPRGDFVGQSLWAFGGHRNEVSGDSVLSMVETVEVPRVLHRNLENQTFLPTVQNSGVIEEWNATFEQAEPIPLNQTINSEFVAANDVADVFFVGVTPHRSIQVSLREIPAGADYDLFVYNNNKGLLGSSINIGNTDETVIASSSSSRMYIVVLRQQPAPGTSPIPQPYSLLVQG